VHNVQLQSGGWVGSSVVHLGDNNVPNSLIFIDKYNQVSRFLQPIVLCIEKLPTIIKDPGVKTYLDETFGGAEKLTMDILLDFFKGALSQAKPSQARPSRAEPPGPSPAHPALSPPVLSPAAVRLCLPCPALPCPPLCLLVMR
jgi:hypothetical protein